MAVPALSQQMQDVLHEFLELQYLSVEELDSLVAHIYSSESRDFVHLNLRAHLTCVLSLVSQEVRRRSAPTTTFAS